MKIGLVAPLPPPYGGIANWVVLMDDYAKGVEDVELLHVNIAPKARDLDGRSLWNRVVVQGFAMLGKNRELSRLITREHVDVVHMTTSGQLAVIRDIMLLKTAKKKGIPSIYHIRFGRIPQIAENNTREWRMIKKAMRLATVVLAIDSSTYRAIQKYAPEVNVRLIPNPFDMKKLKGIEDLTIQPARREVIFVGWVIKTKGVEELLSAWEQIQGDYPDWQLRIVGPYSEEYFAELQQRFSTESVIFDGEKKHDEVMRLVASAGFFVLPSYTEGFPNAVVEAMALRRPIIASAVGAIPDMLDGCGVVIPPRSANALTDALKDMLNSEDKRAELALAAREKMEREYTIETVFSSYRALWESLAAGTDSM